MVAKRQEHLQRMSYLPETQEQAKHICIMLGGSKLSLLSLIATVNNNVYQQRNKY
jgi:hypothetical protein